MQSRPYAPDIAVADIGATSDGANLTAHNASVTVGEAAGKAEQEGKWSQRSHFRWRPVNFRS